MFKNYLKTALRGLLKQKQYTLINIVGLAIGMASVILILVFVQDELSFDNFHTKGDQIYRVNFVTTHPKSGHVARRAIGPYRLAEELRPDFPDFESIIRFAPPGRTLVEYRGEKFYEEKFAYVDPGVFAVFSFDLLEGNPHEVLQDPFSLVVTRTTALKYFGDKNPIGQVLRFEEHDYMVTGVLEDIPANSQFQFGLLASMNAAEQVFPRIVLENWGEGSCETYVVLPPDQRPAAYQKRLSAFVAAKLTDFQAFSPHIELQPLDKLYLHSQNISTYVAGGDITYVYAFSAIALFVLLIACINFMNLATARSANRSKEVGLRKVVGAQRSQLMLQFLSESLLLAIISLLVALGIVALTLPAFNSLSAKTISLGVLGHGQLLATLFGITLFAGIVAGSYPALFLSAFRPTSVLSGTLKRGAKGRFLRRGLVTFQFAVSIFLMIVTAVVASQIDYARSSKLGFKKENLVLLSGTPLSLRARYDQFHNALLADPNIVNAAASSRVPPGRLRSELKARPEGVPENQTGGMQTVWTDFDFVETMGLELASGRSFSRQHPADATSAFMLNEAAVQRIGWTNESAIGKSFGSSEIKEWNSGQWQERNGQVIGVLKDFHFESLRQPIVPTVYFIAPYMAWNYVIRIVPENIPETLASIEAEWQKFNPEEPFVYSFVDEKFDKLYRNEKRQGVIFAVFAGLAILVACLGLVGLASFTAEQRSKEVGVRKVLGASVSHVVVLISKEFFWLVLAAFVVSAPVAWYVMRDWLQAFAYHVALTPGLFVVAGVAALLIAWLTVSYHAVKVAFTNPTTTLRYE